MKDGVDVVKDNMIDKRICKCGKLKASSKQNICEECKDRGRIWDEVKMRYHYIYCKCGEVKESYKSNYCVKCQRDKYNRIKVVSTNWSKIISPIFNSLSCHMYHLLFSF